MLQPTPWSAGSLEVMKKSAEPVTEDLGNRIWSGLWTWGHGHDGKNMFSVCISLMWADPYVRLA